MHAAAPSRAPECEPAEAGHASLRSPRTTRAPRPLASPFASYTSAMHRRRPNGVQHRRLAPSALLLLLLLLPFQFALPMTRGQQLAAASSNLGPSPPASAAAPQAAASGGAPAPEAAAAVASGEGAAGQPPDGLALDKVYACCQPLGSDLQVRGGVCGFIGGTGMGGHGKAMRGEEGEGQRGEGKWGQGRGRERGACCQPLGLREGRGGEERGPTPFIRLYSLPCPCSSCLSPTFPPPLPRCSSHLRPPPPCPSAHSFL